MLCVYIDAYGWWYHVFPLVFTFHYGMCMLTCFKLSWFSIWIPIGMMARCVCDIVNVIVWWMVDDNSYCCKLFMSWLVFLLICNVCVKRMVIHGMLKAWVNFKKMMGMQDGWGKSVGTSQKIGVFLIFKKIFFDTNYVISLPFLHFFFRKWCNTWCEDLWKSK